MKLIVFQDEAYQQLVMEFRKMLVEAIAEVKQEEWLSPEETKKLLGIKSKSKLQQLRDTGEILFSQHGRIIKYSRQSINKFLLKHITKTH
jgi:hypothetical protein